MDSLPQELINRVLDLACRPVISEEDPYATAKACTLVKFSWSYPSRQRMFRAVALNPELLPRWCENIPNSATGPSSFVRTLSLESLDANHLTEHIEHLKAFNQVTKLFLGDFNGDTFEREEIEQCFAHFGQTAQWLSLFVPRCRASLLPHLLKLFTRAIRIDLNIPYTTRDTDQMVYQPLPNLEVLELGLGNNARIDYELLEACTDLRRVFISCPRASSRFWFNHLFIRCADTLNYILIGPERQGQPKSSHTCMEGPLTDLFCGLRSNFNHGPVGGSSYTVGRAHRNCVPGLG